MKQDQKEDQADALPENAPAYMKQQLARQQDREGFAAYRLHSLITGQKARFAGKVLFLLKVGPYLVTAVLLLPLLLFWPRMGKISLIKWLQAYCRLMFDCMGLLVHKHKKKPKRLPAGALIFTLRKDPLQALFFFAHFHQRILIPKSAKASQPWQGLLLSKWVLACFTSWFCYPDQGFSAQKTRLNTLANLGYCSLAYLNEGQSHLFNEDQVSISKELLPFLIKQDQEQRPIYFCHIKNWENAELSNMKNKTLISIDFSNINDLRLSRFDGSAKAQRQVLANFFGRQDFTLSP
eukprot:COSAG01_NODE_93_length_27013_cov_41.515791_4_plen_293_part_00